MSNRCSVDNLASEIIKGLEEYADLTTTKVKTAVSNAGQTAKKEIKANAPKDKGKYAKSWTITTQKETSNTLDIVVHSRNRYQLAHLLENGHAKRGGGRVRAIVHIAPAEQDAIKQLEQEIERGLSNG